MPSRSQVQAVVVQRIHKGYHVSKSIHRDRRSCQWSRPGKPMAKGGAQLAHLHSRDISECLTANYGFLTPSICLPEMVNLSEWKSVVPGSWTKRNYFAFYIACIKRNFVTIPEGFCLSKILILLPVVGCFYALLLGGKGGQVNTRRVINTYKRLTLASFS